MKSKILYLDDEPFNLSTFKVCFIEKYDVFIANINRNILLRDIKEYILYIKAGGELLLSSMGLMRLNFNLDNISSNYFMVRKAETEF